MQRDVRLILACQAVRAFAYGLGAVLLGVSLDRRGLSSTQVGFVLAAVVAGTVLASIGVARVADRVGRRRCYVLLYLGLALTGVVYAVASPLWLLIVVALLGAMSTEVMESGPFTSLEQPMLAEQMDSRRMVQGFGVYNAVATASGSLGALAAGGLGPLRNLWSAAPGDRVGFWLFVPVAALGVLLASQLSPAVEADHREAGESSHLGPSRVVVGRLAALFATDSFGGGFVVQSFIAYWLATRFGATTATIGVVFFSVGILQTASLLAAPRLAARFGVLQTMVFTHLPSNILLAAMAFAPNLSTAVGLLLARVSLSQMDVPTRQAYVITLVTPPERTAAVAYTNTVRYLVRPIGPALAGSLQSLGLGAPFLVAGVVKGTYDVALWRWFRNVPLPPTSSSAPPGGPRRSERPGPDPRHARIPSWRRVR